MADEDRIRRPSQIQDSEKLKLGKDEKLLKALERPKKIIHVIFNLMGFEYEIPEKFLEIPPECDISLFAEASPKGAEKIQKKLDAYMNVIKKEWGASKTKGKGIHFKRAGKDLERAVYDNILTLQPISEDYMDQSVPAVNRVMNVLTFFCKRAKSIKIIPMYERDSTIKAIKALDLHQKQGAEMESSKDVTYELQKKIDKYRYTYVFMLLTLVNKYLPQVLQQYVKSKGWKVDIFFPKEGMSALTGG